MGRRDLVWGLLVFVVFGASHFLILTFRHGDSPSEALPWSVGLGVANGAVAWFLSAWESAKRMRERDEDQGRETEADQTR